MFSLTTFALALSLGSSPGFAESNGKLAVSATASAPDVSSLVGDSDAASKKKSKGKKSSKGSKGGSKGGQSNEKSSDSGSSKGDNSGSEGSSEKSGAPSRTPTGPAQPVEGVQKSSGGAAQTDRSAESSGRESRAATPLQSSGRTSESASASSRTEVRTRSVNTGSGHQTSGGNSSARRPESSHASPNYRGGNSHHVAASRASAQHVPARHVAAVRHKAAAHHGAVVRHRAYASHHAAWAAHRRGPTYWYSPWRVGYPHHWYHGVFVYGPPVVVVDGGGGGGGSEASQARVPKRQVDRAGKFSLGLRGASYLSGFQTGGSYGDSGLGIAARYRPIDALGIEVQWTYHDATWSQETARIQQPLSVSAELFAFPWSRVNPYVLGGLTFTDRNLNQPLVGGTFQTDEALWGPHAGVGLEFGLGKSASLNLDARFIGYVNKGVDDPARAGAMQANAGLNFYF